MPPVTLADVKRTVNDALAGSLAVNTGFQIEKYTGDISAEAEDWIESYEDTTTLKGWDDAQRFKNFNQFLESDAKNWYKLYVKKAVNPPADWAALRRAFTDYHVPQDREKELRDKMVKKKQSTDDVMKYITEKHLLCLDMNPAMTFGEMKKHIIDGMHPDIKVTITHKPNTDMATLQENAKNIEKGLKEGGKWNSFNQQSNQNDALIAKSLATLSNALENLLITQEETKQKVLEIERQNRRENREKPKERHVEFDRYGRRVIDRSGDYYVNNSRKSSHDDYRNYSANRDYSPYRSYDKSERNQQRVRDSNCEEICFECGEYGHYDNHCPHQYRQQSTKSRTNALQYQQMDGTEEVEDLIYQNIEINGYRFSALIDSGSTISLISETIVRRLNLKMRTYRGKSIKNVDGLLIAIVGEVDITIKVNFEGGSKETDIKAAVIRNFQFDLLLGNDYNRKADVMIDCKRKCLIWPKRSGEHCLSLQHCQPKSLNYIHLLRDVTLPPLIQVQVKVSPKDRVNNRFAKLMVKTESYLFNKNKILLNDTPIQFIGGKANINLINCSTKDITLKSGTVVGVFEEIQNTVKSEVKDQESEDSSDEICLSDSSEDDRADQFRGSSHRVNMTRFSATKLKLNESTEIRSNSIERRDVSIEKNIVNSQQLNNNFQISVTEVNYNNPETEIDECEANHSIKIDINTKNTITKKISLLTISFLIVLIIFMPNMGLRRKFDTNVSLNNQRLNSTIIRNVVDNDLTCQQFMEEPFIKFNKEYLKKFRDKINRENNIQSQRKSHKTVHLLNRTNKVLIHRTNADSMALRFEHLIISIIIILSVFATAVIHIHTNREEIKTLKIMISEANERTKSIEELMKKIMKEKKLLSRFTLNGSPQELNTSYNL